MSNAHQSLEIAQANLRAAEEAALRERVEKAKHDLTAARAQARQTTKDIEIKRKEFAQIEAECEKPGERLAILQYLIPTLVCDEEFPTEAELKAVEGERNKLIAERDEILCEGRNRGARVERLRDEIVGMEYRLEGLRRSISNLEVIAHGGRIGTNFEGWVRPVAGLPSR